MAADARQGARRTRRGAPVTGAGLLDEVADVLRQADFAMDRAAVALVAFVPAGLGGVGRDLERMAEVRKRIADVLPWLPPEPPLTPEQEAEYMAKIGDAIRRRFGDG